MTETIPESRRGPVSEDEKRHRTLLLVLEQRSVIGRVRTRVQPKTPEGADRFISARLHTKSEFPHGPRTFHTLLDLANDGLIDYTQRRRVGKVEQIVDEFTVKAGLELLR